MLVCTLILFVMHQKPYSIPYYHPLAQLTHIKVSNSTDSAVRMLTQ